MLYWRLYGCHGLVQVQPWAELPKSSYIRDLIIDSVPTKMMTLLEQLCRVHAPSGNEGAMKQFILDYVAANQAQWAVKPAVVTGPEFHDCIILVFGQPRTCIYAHMDSIGFTVRYNNQLVPIGGPDVKNGYQLQGQDGLGPIECTLAVDENNALSYEFGRGIERGTELVFACDFRETEDFVQSCYLDNRLGVYNALKVAETLQNGAIAFSCYEEHGGGSVGYLANWCYKQHGIRQALVSDITWITEGVQHGLGAAISLRDRYIPRRVYIERILSLVANSGIPYQLEVEGAGASDGKDLQLSHLPIDWCFIGAAEDFVHTPNEKVHKADIDSMIQIYTLLMEKL